MDIKNILHPIIQFFFSSDSQQPLMDCILNSPYYNILTCVLLLMPIVLLILFYRVWDPISKQILKWTITVIVIAIILFVATRYFLIDLSPCMIELFDNYDESIHGLLNPNPFMYYVSGFISIISVVLTFLFSLVIRKISINNSHNPF